MSFHIIFQVIVVFFIKNSGKLKKICSFHYSENNSSILPISTNIDNFIKFFYKIIYNYEWIQRQLYKFLILFSKIRNNELKLKKKCFSIIVKNVKKSVYLNHLMVSYIQLIIIFHISMLLLKNFQHTFYYWIIIFVHV